MSCIYQAYGAEYHQAIGPATQALFIQSGTKDAVNSLKERIENKGLKMPIAIATFGYQTFKQKSIEVKNIKSPFVDDVKHNMRFKQHEALLTTEWKF
jgi:hypothetical protein